MDTQEVQSATQKAPSKKRSQKIFDVYAKSMITRKVKLSINTIGSGLKQTLEQKTAYDIEGKCIPEGFVRPGSCKIVSYSSGSMTTGQYVFFMVVVECDICLPVEGMIIQCVATNITKAGIRAEIEGESDSPVVIFIARDHHFTSEFFSQVNEKDSINVRVIGQRFELNDKYVSVIAELIEPKKAKMPKLVFKEEE